MLERRKIMDLITYKGCLLIFLLRLPGDAIRVVGKCLKMLYLSGFTVYLVFRQIIVNSRHLLQKWGTDGVRYILKWGMKIDSYNLNPSSHN